MYVNEVEITVAADHYAKSNHLPKETAALADTLTLFALTGHVEQLDHPLLVLGQAAGEAHPHAAEGDGDDFQLALADLPFSTSARV